MADAWGGSWGTAWGVSWGGVAAAIPVTPIGGSRNPHKKVRGPYSDHRIYEQYIARCIAERAAPRTDTAEAVLKEALVGEVEERWQTGYDERDALLRENLILERLLTLETARRDLRAIELRQRQIARQLDALDKEEAGILLALVDWMED
jgi:hypothetical protein